MREFLRIVTRVRTIILKRSGKYEKLTVPFPAQVQGDQNEQ